MARHHIVQDKYLTQWRKADTENQLNIYVIPENNIIERGPGWKGFWREDFNVLNSDDGKSYLPEDIASLVDTKGIEAIKRIDRLIRAQLDGTDRSFIAFYVALQYVRTPRRREETNKLMRATIQHFMRKDISSVDHVHMTKAEILKHTPINKHEEKALEEISKMSDEEVRQKIFESIHGGDYVAGLNNTGHSKQILKVDREAKELFESQWLFLVAPKGTSFVTSDNPCFTISTSKIMNGLLSPKSIVFFPLKPDICIYIRPGIKSQKEEYLDLNEKEVDEINQLVLFNSYECVVAKDREQLENLTKEYNYKNHKKSRDVTISELGDYTMFNME